MSLSNIETEQQRFNICFEKAYWDKNQLIERRIVSAANRYKLKDGGTIVVPGTRHCSKDMAAVVDLILDKIVSRHTADQGFVDQFANYWTREEALVIATRAGQINTVRKKSNPEHQLFSEDLY